MSNDVLITEIRAGVRRADVAWRYAGVRRRQLRRLDAKLSIATIGIALAATIFGSIFHEYSPSNLALFFVSATVLVAALVNFTPHVLRLPQLEERLNVAGRRARDASHAWRRAEILLRSPDSAHPSYLKVARETAVALDTALEGLVVPHLWEECELEWEPDLAP